MTIKKHKQSRKIGQTLFILVVLTIISAWVLNSYSKSSLPTATLIKQAKALYENQVIDAPEQSETSLVNDRTNVDTSMPTPSNLQYQIQQFYQAIHQGNEEWLLQLLSTNIDINFSNALSTPSPLFAAIVARRINIVELLVAAGANTIDPRSKFNALHESIRANSQELVEFFIHTSGVDVNARNDLNETSLNIALSNRQYAIAEQLIDAGAVVDMAHSSGKNILHRAAMNGDITLAQFLLDNGANINSKDEHQNTALTIALESNQLSMAELLYKRQAHIDLSGEKVADIFYAAVRQGETPLLKLLLEFGVSPNVTRVDKPAAAFVAITADRPEILALMLQHGLNPKVENDKGISLLANAARFCTPCINVLLDYDASIEFGGQGGQKPGGFMQASPLLWAVSSRKYDAVEILIKAGANVSAVSSENTTALSSAAAGDAELVKLLLQAGADPNQRSRSQWPALIMASSSGNSSIIDLLIQSGADVNLGNWHGFTPLHAAVQAGHIPRLQMLLAAGADINQRTRRGWTALTEAKYQGNFDIADWLTKRGAIDPINIGLRPRSTRNQLSIQIKVGE